ncbi:type IV toxin-antitoxin system AbiEi family antitoxin domain-containing protein [Nocardioides sediminis]|uniref:type IV toxin-antitoxin system AbiEi family antitoxin domain-containing protein n=1 Tax=Nocardioides sediminis TaxID=433648 RepID=UPI00131F0A4B|nr:type IV toxin-antitoxin system AbiEi family antitoxin domain-containing protein [Nocardioides sediminis]
MPRRRDSRLDSTALRRLMDRQSGVVSRRQVKAAGGDDVDIRNKVRRREWARVHDGVYVDHTGPLTRSQRVWAAVLLHWPAAVHRQTAMELYGLRRDRRQPGPDDPVWVMIDAGRRSPAPVPGVRVERIRDASTWLTSHRWPPRVTVELALLKVASQRDLAGAVAVLADACQQSRTDVTRLLTALDRLGNLPGRAALVEVPRDVADGAYSVLERRYMRDVERAHGLPVGRRRFRESSDGRTVARDVKYPAQGVVVELDGRFGHRDLEDRWTDLDRDLASAVDALLTVRLGWAQVLSPCRVATAMGTILRARGWTGTPAACRTGCPVPTSWAVAAH